MLLSTLLALCPSALAPALPVVSPANAQAPAGPAAAEGRSLVVLDLVHDSIAHGAFLDELADLRRAGAHGEFRARLALEQERQSLQRGALRAELAQRGVEVVRERWLTESIVVAGPAGALEGLQGLEGVAAVRTDSRRAPASLTQALNANHHDAVGAHLLTTSGGVPVEGDGVVVAVIDTGLDTDMNGTGLPHAAFYEDADKNNDSGGIGGSRILSAEKFSLFASAPQDLHGHGSRMGGILAGAKFAGFQGLSDGVAPKALLRSYRIDDDSPLGLASTVAMANAFEAAAAQPDVRVANMSYDGSLEFGIEPNVAIDNAARAGLLITLSAGNDGASNTFFHGAYNALPVGASDINTMEPFNDPSVFISAVGPLPDGRVYPKLIAVGEKLTSVVIDDESNVQNSNGTSGAAAIVAGTAALLFQVDPTLTQREARALLANTALEVTLGDEEARGFGYIHTRDAVEAALAGLSSDADGVESTYASYAVTLAEAEVFTATLAWDRVQTAFDVPADLDLVLLSPDGIVVAESRHPFDTMEQVRATAPVAGEYEVRVEARGIEPGQPSAPYGLATSSPATASGGGSLCSAGAASGSVFQSGPVDLLAYPFFSVKGCGLASTTAVSVDGAPAAFSILSDALLRVTVPAGSDVGSLPVAITAAGGTLTASVNVGVSAPKLDTSYTVGSQDPLTFNLAGEPGELFAVFYSFVQAPTTFPGVIDFLIGGGATNLFLLYGPGVLNGSGFANQGLGLWPVPNPPAGLKIYMQAAVHSSAAGSDWIPSNMNSTLVIF